MKRLTGRAPDGTAYLYNMGGTNAAIDRLAAYEDTGLEPEELEYIARAKRGERMVTEEELKQAGVSQAEIDRLFEIAVAESEGRLLVLPCKVGTHLWKVTHPYKAEPKVTEFVVKNIRTAGKKHRMQIEVQAVNVPATNWMEPSKFYRTREEAEAALRKEQENE